MKTIASIPLPVLFNPIKLQDDLSKIVPEEWVSHYRGDHYEGGWSVVPLRSIGGHPAVIHSTPASSTANFYKDTPILERCTYFQTVINWFQCQINGARLMCLDPGARILEHTDDMYGGDVKELRIHIPVQTNPQVEFWVDGQLVPMQEGETWFADFNLPHSVNNRGSTPRIHLVLDCSMDEWLVAQLEKGRQIASMTRFLNNIGIETISIVLDEETFLPGIQINNGALFYDYEKLLYPGDLLHEAGHIAVSLPEERATLSGNVGEDKRNALAVEIAAILWSYAALKDIDLPAELVFHENGYKGQSDWFLSNLKEEKNYIGMPMLEWMGMAVGEAKAMELGIEPFPKMVRWLR